MKTFLKPQAGPLWGWCFDNAAWRGKFTEGGTNFVALSEQEAGLSAGAQGTPS